MDALERHSATGKAVAFTDFLHAFSNLILATILRIQIRQQADAPQQPQSTAPTLFFDKTPPLKE